HVEPGDGDEDRKHRRGLRVAGGQAGCLSQWDIVMTGQAFGGKTAALDARSNGEESGRSGDETMNKASSLPSDPGEAARAFGSNLGEVWKAMSGLSLPLPALSQLQADYLSEAAGLWNQTVSS